MGRAIILNFRQFILLLLIIVSYSHLCHAQKDLKLDSLLLALSIEKNDSTKVNILNALSVHHWSITAKYTDARIYADSALNLAKKTSFKKGIAASYSNIAVVCTYQRNFIEAHENILTSLKLYEVIGDKKGIVSSYLKLGLIYNYQNNNSEALKNCLASLKLYNEIGDKKGIADTYIRIGNIYNNQSKYSEAKKNYLSALKIFEQIGDKKEIASSYNNLGLIYDNQGNYPEALKNHLASMKLREEIGDKAGIAISYNNIGNIYIDQGNYSEALKNYLSSLKIKEEIGDKKGIASSYNNLGLIYDNQGNYPEALKNYLSALKIFEEIGDKNGIAYCYINIGFIYHEQGNYPDALKNCLSSLKILEELEDKKGIAASYNNIGFLYHNQGNYPEALKSYIASLKIEEEIGNKMGIAESYNNIGGICSEQGNYPEALKSYLASLKIKEEIGNKSGIPSVYINLSDLKIKLGKLIEAKKYLDDGLLISKEIGSKNYLMEIYKRLTKLDSVTGNYLQALENYKLYTFYKDSLYNESNSQVIAEMKTKYETEKKDKEIQNLESEKVISNLELKVQQEALFRIKLEKEKILTENLFNRQQVNLLANEKRLQELEIEKNAVEFAIQKVESDRKQDQVMLLNKEGEIQKLEIKKQTQFKNYLLGGLALFCLLTFFAYNNYSTRQKLKLQTLRNKIASDLHDDVGSTLSSISIFSELAQQQSKEVIPLLDTIGESSRKMLDAMADIVWTINPENDQFEKIILRMRSFAYELLGAKNIDFEFIADDDISKIKLPMEVRKNLYLIFKEATNNMVKYSNADKAKFEIRNESDQLNLMIRDNGKGFDLNKSTEGNGLKNMRKRAQEIGATFLIETFPGNGTSIVLKIAN